MSSPIVVEGPSWGDLRKAIQKKAIEDKEWCGMPMPVPGKALDLFKKHPMRERLSEVFMEKQRVNFGPAEKLPELERGVKFINEWSSQRHGLDIIVLENKWGRRFARFHDHHLDVWVTDVKPLDFQQCDLRRMDIAMNTMEAGSYAWDYQAELKARETLKTMLNDLQWESYDMAGMFPVRGPRSGVHYIVRRLRPTIALRAWNDNDAMHFLAALCLHPLGYYRGTYAGAMVPTDDVIAHLLLIRGDEHLYWKRCSQHPAWRPEAGL